MTSTVCKHKGRHHSQKGGYFMNEQTEQGSACVSSVNKGTSIHKIRGKEIDNRKRSYEGDR